MNLTSIVCLHDSSGNVDALGPLVSHLHPNLTVLGLERPHTETKLQTITDLASEHLKRLATFQLPDPWCLVGWSFGGDLAFEMTRQIEAKGQKVELLVLIDSQPPISNIWEEVYKHSLQIINEFDYGKVNVNLDSLIKSLILLDDPIETIYAKLPVLIRNAILPFKNTNVSQFCQALVFVLDHVRLLACYEPVDSVHPNNTICIKASNSEKNVHKGWSTWIDSPIAHKEVLGDHRSILNAPAVEQIASEINDALFQFN